jgi:hypothetical protein
LGDESSAIRFTGFGGGATTPAALGGSGVVVSSTGQGVTELGGTDVVGSSSPRGGIAGGQFGFNWQRGMLVFGAELDAQWDERWMQQIARRLSCGVHVVPEFALAQPYTEVPNTGQFLPVRWTNSKRQFSFEVAATSSPYTFATS